MPSQKKHTPVYQQFISFVKKGFAALNDEQQDEIKKFIHSCQHRNGAFTDRAGSPDYYYSLFGTWLSVALNLQEVLNKHHQFILRSDETPKDQVEDFAALLIKISLPGYCFNKPARIYLLKRMILRKSHVSFFYRIFLFFLAFDALYSSRIIYLTGRGVLVFISPPPGSPASIHAAYTLAKHKAGGCIEREQRLLLTFFEKNKGFKSYREIEDADLLSTAVALFTLKVTGADLRKIAPDCLNFIQQNYDNGAFLAGNGDNVRDLEYTFYGLLALGVLV